MVILSMIVKRNIFGVIELSKNENIDEGIGGNENESVHYRIIAGTLEVTTLSQLTLRTMIRESALANNEVSL